MCRSTRGSDLGSYFKRGMLVVLVSLGRMSRGAPSSSSSSSSLTSLLPSDRSAIKKLTGSCHQLSGDIECGEIWG